MALICIGSQRGSPGATTAALALAGAWPVDEGRGKVLIEADPAGGVLAVRYGLGIEPGLVTLAAAMRGRPDADVIWDHAQVLPGGLRAVVGADNPGVMDGTLAAAGERLGAWLAGHDQLDAIVDIGRIRADTAAGGLIDHADLTLVVARPNAEQLQPGAHRLATLDGPAAWLLIGDRPHDRAAVEAAYGIAVAGVLADDPRGAAALATGRGPGRLGRTMLVRAAAGVAEEVVRRCRPDRAGIDAGGGAADFPGLVEAVRA